MVGSNLFRKDRMGEKELVLLHVGKYCAFVLRCGTSREVGLLQVPRAR